MNNDREQKIVAIFRAAWRGVRRKETKSNPPHSRYSERYLHELRKARTPERRRSVISEFLAEGLLEVGGSEDFSGPDAAGTLWRDGEADGWEKLRELALLASAIGGEP